jgi:hypothetical protein
VLLMDACDGVEPLFLQAKEAQPSVLAVYYATVQTAVKDSLPRPGAQKAATGP